ncbi:S1 family peptidase [Mycobacteroides saopaulense]|uniref:S1 family peptidase n=1 Tax=Mycobacteroides saopaulense TaxID=1578165 RepID=UPI001F232C53|nr:S1 family peptidase [Mycobacteroides saopaulense]
MSGTPVSDTPNAPAAGAAVSVTPSGVTTRWVDVTGQGVIAKDSHGGQFGSLPYPGITILQQQGDESSKNCTLGPAVVDKTSQRTGFVGAGHCDDSPGGQTFVLADYEGTEAVPVGVYANSKDAPTPMGYSDSAVIWTKILDPRSTLIAGTWPVAGVMPAADVRKLRAGTPVCIDGAKSGVVCSPLVGATNDYILTAPMTQPGDSGAAVFLVDEKTLQATLIGIHSGTEDGHSEATFLEPALTRLGATALTASP